MNFVDKDGTTKVYIPVHSSSLRNVSFHLLETYPFVKFLVVLDLSFLHQQKETSLQNSASFFCQHVENLFLLKVCFSIQSPYFAQNC